MFERLASGPSDAHRDAIVAACCLPDLVALLSHLAAAEPVADGESSMTATVASVLEQLTLGNAGAHHGAIVQAGTLPVQSCCRTSPRAWRERRRGRCSS